MPKAKPKNTTTKKKTATKTAPRKTAPRKTAPVKKTSRKKPTYASEKKTIKGLSIATIALSSLSILIALTGIFYIAIAFGLVRFGDVALDIASKAQLGYETSIENENLIIGNTVSNIVGLFNVGLGIILSFTIFSLFTSSYSLIVAIISLTSLDKRKYPEKVFVLNVLNAVFSFISINMVRCLVSIASSIFIYKIRK